MSTKSWHIPRRTFLRGVGAAIALPWLDAMQPLSAFGATVPKPPVRMGCLFFPNGVWVKDWVPATAGADYELPATLQPLSGVKSDVLVISGLDKAKSHDGDGHYAKDANFLTGLHVNRTSGRDISAGGISMDQFAAQLQGGRTPLPSLELGIDPVASGVDMGYTRLYACHISWRAANIPVDKEISPRAAYERLFGASSSKDKSPATAADARDDRSLLDMALEDAHDLRKKLGRDDQLKVDEYLESVRSLEKQIEFASKQDTRDWHPEMKPTLTAPAPGIPGDYQKHVGLMLDLIVLAFQTDQTRIASFMFANSVSPRSFRNYLEGVKEGHHELSHHRNDPEKIRGYSAINKWHVEQFAQLLEKMKNVKEGPGTLLDNSLMLFGSGFSDGNRHDPTNIPILLGGRGGGAIKPGRHIANPDGTPLCNLYLSMLNAIGVDVPHFGDSSQRLKEIET
jgi:hypothetical protein